MKTEFISNLREHSSWHFSFPEGCILHLRTRTAQNQRQRWKHPKEKMNVWKLRRDKREDDELTWSSIMDKSSSPRATSENSNFPDASESLCEKQSVSHEFLTLQGQFTFHFSLFGFQTVEKIDVSEFLIFLGAVWYMKNRYMWQKLDC